MRFGQCSFMRLSSNKRSIQEREFRSLFFCVCLPTYIGWSTIGWELPFLTMCYGKSLPSLPHFVFGRRYLCVCVWLDYYEGVLVCRTMCCPPFPHLPGLRRVPAVSVFRRREPASHLLPCHVSSYKASWLAVFFRSRCCKRVGKIIKLLNL